MRVSVVYNCQRGRSGTSEDDPIQQVSVRQSVGRNDLVLIAPSANIIEGLLAPIDEELIAGLGEKWK